MWDRPGKIAGACGILFVVLFVVGVLVQGDVPMYDEGGEEITAWFADNSDQYLVGDFITGLAFIFFYFPFLVGLYIRLRFAEAGPPLFSRVALIGGILFPLAGLAGGIVLAGVALLDGAVSPDTASFASAASYHSFTGVSGLQAVLVGASAIVILRYGGFWTWLGWLGAIVAAAAVIGSAASVEKDPEGVLSIFGIISFVGLGVWILAASVRMLQVGEVEETLPTAT